MTWQRVDENTYIDYTLVTCAEYQLFIDEMRQQGKHYQPDHWSSYQFPKGHAREPILGVRHSDATALCEWLTNREDKKSIFRLPSKNEIVAYPINPTKRSLLGYWLNGDIRFVWIGAIRKDVHPLDFFDTITSEMGLSRLLRKDLEIIDQARNTALGAVQQLETLDTSQGAHRALARTIIRNINHIFDFNHKRDTNLNNIRGLANNLSKALDNLDDGLVINQMINHDFAQSLAKRLFHLINLNSVINYERIIDIQENRLSSKNSTRVSAFATDLALAITSAQTLYPDFNLARVENLYNYIFTLRERIAGRSPAFEGIRLIKERIR